MSDRFFLDTNIFVYSFDENVPDKARRALDLIRRALKTGKGIVSYQVVQEFFNVALKRFASPMTTTDAEAYLNTVFRPLLVTHSSHGLYAEALRVKERYHLPWYDSLIVTSAMETGCETLYTEDLQDGQRFGHIRVANPFAGKPAKMPTEVRDNK
jgi:predicted nucleic acid-binding protein